MKFFLLKNFLIIFFSFLFTSRAVSQDSLKVNKSPVKINFQMQEGYWKDFSPEWKSIDTSLLHYHYSGKVNGNNFPFANLGNQNTSSESLWYNAKYSGGTDAGIHQQDQSFFLPENLKLFSGTRRFTELQYILASGSDQQFNITYFQQVSSTIFAGLDFARSRSEGFFEKQITSTGNFDFYIYGNALKSHYNFLAFYISNFCEQEENGGVIGYQKSQQDYEQSVYLLNAASTNHDRIFAYNHFWSFKKGGSGNKNPDDSLPQKINSESKFNLRIGHAFSYSRNSFTFSSARPDSGFFAHSYFDTLATHDSLFYDDLKNELKLDADFFSGTDSLKKNKLSVSLSANSQLLKTEQGDAENDTVKLNLRRVNLWFAFRLCYESADRFKISAEASYTSYGSNTGNFHFAAETKKYFGQKNYFGLSVFSQKQSATVTEEFFFSNHFVYGNIFVPVLQQQVKAQLGFDRQQVQLTGSATNVNNLIYFGTDQLPHQSDEAIKIYQATLKKNFRFGKFHTEHELMYQKISDDQYMHVPEWSTKHEIYYENIFFKRALFAQIGMDVRTMSSYHPDGYQPATGKFFVQDSLRANDLLGGDFFINLRIKAARLFFKFENVEQLFSNEINYQVLNYPHPGFIVRFGISMRFFD